MRKLTESLPGFENVELTGRVYKHALDALSVIREHSIENPIYGKEIAEKVGITEPELRKIVGYFRMKGEPIGSGGKGYFYARNRWELENTLNHLAGRWRKIKAEWEGLIEANGSQDSLFGGEVWRDQ